MNNSSEIGGKKFVYFTVIEGNCLEPAKQQQKGKNRTRRKIFCTFNRVDCFVFCYSVRYFLWNLSILNCIFKTKSSDYLFFLDYLIYPDPTNFYHNTFLPAVLVRLLCFLCHFAMCSEKFYHLSIFQDLNWKESGMRNVSVCNVNVNVNVNVAIERTNIHVLFT